LADFREERTFIAYLGVNVGFGWSAAAICR